MSSEKTEKARLRRLDRATVTADGVGESLPYDYFDDLDTEHKDTESESKGARKQRHKDKRDIKK